MKVTATSRGYYGGVVREPGDVFEIADKSMFSATWMERGDAPKDADPADGDKKPAKRGRKPKDADPTDPMTPAERINMAKELSGRSDIETVAEADRILAEAGGV